VRWRADKLKEAQGGKRMQEGKVRGPGNPLFVGGVVRTKSEAHEKSWGARRDELIPAQQNDREVKNRNRISPKSGGGTVKGKVGSS